MQLGVQRDQPFAVRAPRLAVAARPIDVACRPRRSAAPRRTRAAYQRSSNASRRSGATQLDAVEGDMLGRGDVASGRGCCRPRARRARAQQRRAGGAPRMSTR